MKTFALVALCCLLLAALQPCMAQPIAPDCNASPGPQHPACTGIFSQWDDDELECDLGNGVELKCDYDTELFGANEIQCQLDGTGILQDVSFSCPIIGECGVNCDYPAIAATVLPYTGSQGLATLEDILTTWIPSE